ncbi:unnamed protein product [Orchesella dallaii]|uniref:Endonuclease/exonuclease/phosphatase domain-containing protein n=1 Tax=Orchesella dallaii TaxID=48710 RepID=A0ABP1SA08_9HEXA
MKDSKQSLRAKLYNLINDHDGPALIAGDFNISITYKVAVCKKNENMRIRDNLATSFEGKCFQKFWKHVKAADTPHTQTLSTELDGRTSESEISQYCAKIYELQYGGLFSSNQSERHAENVQCYIKLNRQSVFNITPTMVHCPS